LVSAEPASALSGAPAQGLEGWSAVEARCLARFGPFDIIPSEARDCARMDRLPI